MELRAAAAADLPAIQSIYAHHVLRGLASFEEVPPDVGEMRRRHAEVTDSIRRVVLSAWQLDLFGDLGDQSKLAEAYRLFTAAVDDIGSAYGSQR